MPKQTALCQVIEAYGTDVAANIATIKSIAVGDYRFGSVGGALAATLTFYGSTTEEGVFEIMANAAGTAHSGVKGANELIQIPDAVLQGAKYLKIINDAAQEDFRITLKS